MDLISSLHRKLQDVTEECDAANEEYQNFLNQIKLCEDDQKHASLGIMENEEKIRDVQFEISNKKKCLSEMEKNIRISNQEIECLESSLDQLPRTMLKICIDFADSSAKYEKIVNSICNGAVKNQFWDDMISQAVANVEKSRDAYKNRCKQLSICKEAKGKALEKVLLREEQRFSDLKSRIDFYETRIEQFRLQNSRPLPAIPMQTPAASPGSDPQQEFELVSTHTVIEEMVEFRVPMAFNNNTSNMRFMEDESSNYRSRAESSSSFTASDGGSDFHRPQQQSSDVPWFLQHKRRRLPQQQQHPIPTTYRTQSSSAAAETTYNYGAAVYDHDDEDM